jgi:CspA family cold shock protein
VACDLTRESLCAILSADFAQPEPFRLCEVAETGYGPVVPDILKTIVVKEVLSMDGEMMGTVKWFSRMKGWGFIEPDDGERDVFVHYENIVGDGFRNLEKGERVRFRVEDTDRGPKALEVVNGM